MRCTEAFKDTTGVYALLNNQLTLLDKFEPVRYLFCNVDVAYLRSIYYKVQEDIESGSIYIKN